jgi:hypothetical protein
MESPWCAEVTQQSPLWTEELWSRRILLLERNWAVLRATMQLTAAT